MIWDILPALALIFSVFIMWIQRKTIMELESEVWEIEQAYKNETGKVYRYKRRTFELWGNDGGKQEKEQI